MGTILTVIIGGAVIGYAVTIIMGIAKKTKAGECSGCGQCPSAEKCGSKRGF